MPEEKQNPPPKRRPFALLAKILLGVTCGLLLSVLITLNALLIWVATDTRSLDRFKPTIESLLSDEAGKWRVEVEHTLLLWDGWRHPLDVRLKNVRVLLPEQELARLETVSVDLDLLALLGGHLRLNKVAVRDPVIQLFRDEEGNLRFGLEHGEKPEAPSGERPPLAAVFNENAPQIFTHLNRIEILNAGISLHDAHGEVLTARNVNLLFARVKGGHRADIDAEVLQPRLDMRAGRIQASLQRTETSGDLYAYLNVSNMYAPTVFDILPMLPQDNRLDATLKGTVEVQATAQGRLTYAHVIASSGPGVIHTGMLEAPRPLRHADIEAFFQKEAGTENISRVTLKRFSANIGNADIQADGMLRLKDEDMEISLNGKAFGVPIGDIRYWWPVSLAPISREWVVENIQGGTATLAAIAVRIGFGDLARASLPAEAIDANIQFQEGRVSYLPGHLPVTAAHGRFHVDGQSLDVTVDGASYGDGSRVSSGRVFIRDLAADNPRIEINFDADVLAADAVRFLKLPPVELAEHIGLDEKTAEGRAQGRVKLAFSYFLPRDAHGKIRDDVKQIELEVAAALQNAQAPKFLGRFDIAQATGELNVTDEQVAYRGNLKAGGIPASASVLYYFTPRDGIDTELKVEGTATPEALAKLGYTLPEGFRGPLGLDVELRQGPERKEMKAAVNLEKAALDIRPLHYRKEAGIPAMLNADTVKDGERQHVRSLNYVSQNEVARGTAVLSADFSDIESVTLDELRHGQSNAALTYAPIDGGWSLKAEGEGLDVSPWMDADSGTFAFSKIPALDIDLKVKRLILGQNREVSNVNARILCNKTLCEEANVKGTAGSGEFTYHLTRPSASVRELSASAADMGAFLRALDMHDNIYEGSMKLSGRFDDANPVHPLKGRLTAAGYVVKGAPVLAKLLTLVSPTGLLDTLQGNGIMFKKLDAPFTLAKDVITLEEAKTSGAALGLTAEGTITFPGQVMDVKGTVVPSYTLNSMAGNIPIVGKVLTGEEGGGVFAARYSVKGKGDEAEVTVNPLSMLTPGFLRGVFDVFDSEEDKTQ